MKIQSYSIIPEKGLDKWVVIDGLVRDYIRMYPEEMKQLTLENRMRRKTQKNKYASSLSGIRLGASVPQDLLIIIKRFYPEVFIEKKEFQKFLRKFPGFAIPETI